MRGLCVVHGACVRGMLSVHEQLNHSPSLVSCTLVPAVPLFFFFFCFISVLTPLVASFPRGSSPIQVAVTLGRSQLAQALAQFVSPSIFIP